MMMKKTTIIILLFFVLFVATINVVAADGIDSNRNYTNFYTDDDCNMYYTDVYTGNNKIPNEKIYVAPHTNVKEQTDGDCFAFGTISTIESTIIKKTGYYTDLSEEHVANIHYANEESVSDGAYLPLFVDNIEKSGVVMGYTVKNSRNGFEVEHAPYYYAFLKNEISFEDYQIALRTLQVKYTYGYLKTIPVDAHYVDLHNTALVKKAIKEYGAVVCGLNIADSIEIWYNNINNAFKATKLVKDKCGEWVVNTEKGSDRDYYLSYVCKGGCPDHCVSLIGWNDYLKCFIFKNSYGCEKGSDGGYGFVKYNDASLFTDQGGFVFDVDTKKIKPFKDTKKVKIVKKIKISKKIKSLKQAKKLKSVKRLLKSIKKVHYKLKKGLLVLVYCQYKFYTNYKIV